MGKTKKRKKNKKLIKALRIMIAVIVAAIVLFVAGIILLRVRSYDVEGDVPYSDAEVITASGVVNGKSMLNLDLEEIKNNIETQLPYMDNVRITKRLPFTLVIKGETAKEVYAVILTKGLYAITNSDTKILEVSSVIPDGTIMVEGTLGSFNYTIGTKVDFVCEGETDDVRTSLAEISSALDESGFDEISYINVTDNNDIYLIYNDRIIIRLGSSDNLEKKLSLAKKSIDEENKLSSSQYGELDVSASSKAIFAPKDYKDMTTLVEFDENMAAIEEKILDDDENIDEISTEDEEDNG